MKHIVMIDELDYKEVVSALRRLRMDADSLPPCFVAGDIDVQVERIEKVFGLTEEAE